MSVTFFVLDDRESRIRVHTFAEGMFSRLAHDLELVARNVSGHATLDDSRASGSGELSIDIDAIEVVGALGRTGSVDTNVLSASDCRDILAKMRRDVFRAERKGVIEIRSTWSSASCDATVVLPNGRSLAMTVRASLRDPSSERIVLEGEARISLDAIGSKPIQGPMRAFRVKDEVRVLFELAFRAS